MLITISLFPIFKNNTKFKLLMVQDHIFYTLCHKCILTCSDQKWISCNYILFTLSWWVLPPEGWHCYIFCYINFLLLCNRWHKFNGLKQHVLLTHSFHVSGIQLGPWFSVFQGYKQGVGQAVPFLKHGVLFLAHMVTGRIQVLAVVALSSLFSFWLETVQLKVELTHGIVCLIV